MTTQNIVNLQQVVENVRSEISVDVDGRGKFSVRAGSRICDIHHSSLQHQFSKPTSKLYVTLTEAGFNPEDFAVSGIPDLAMALVVDYYANEAGLNCTEFARQAQRAFSTIGVRTWCQKVVGWTEVNRNAGVVTTDTVENMFSSLMETIENLKKEASENVQRLNKQIEKQELLLEAKDVEINQMKQEEKIREAKLLLYPGLKEAVAKALEWDDNQVDQLFTLKEFCKERGLLLTNGQMRAIGKMATDFCRIAVMRPLPKNKQNHTLYSQRFEAIVQVAVREVLGLNG
jgi:hypothetical protein